MYVGTYLSWLRPTSDARCYTSHDVEKENLFKGRDTLPLSIYHEDDMSKKTLFGGIFAHLAVAAIGWFWREKSVLTSQQHHLLRPVSLPHQKEEKVKVRFPSGLFQITFSFFLSASSFQMFVHHHISEDEGDMRFCFIPNNLMFENWMVVVEVVWYVVLSSSQMELQSLWHSN